MATAGWSRRRACFFVPSNVRRWRLFPSGSPCGQHRPQLDRRRARLGLRFKATSESTVRTEVSRPATGHTGGGTAQPGQLGQAKLGACRSHAPGVHRREQGRCSCHQQQGRACSPPRLWVGRGGAGVHGHVRGWQWLPGAQAGGLVAGVHAGGAADGRLGQHSVQRRPGLRRPARVPGSLPKERPDHCSPGWWGGRHEPGAFHSILLHLMSLIKNIVVLISRIWFIFIIAICHMESTTHYYILATVFYAFFRIDF